MAPYEFKRRKTDQQLYDQAVQYNKEFNEEVQRTIAEAEERYRASFGGYSSESSIDGEETAPDFSFEDNGDMHCNDDYSVGGDNDAAEQQAMDASDSDSDADSSRVSVQPTNTVDPVKAQTPVQAQAKKALYSLE
ncbi:hypothetical protein INT47_013183 [Mucor saturninus]|uniref:Uncharacterized protein n=1 Tax=Mucor saturninus TaxID=64648 RepID=A0A8H7USA7_9FUNG|nr:hypothetical protein INT47_013183 [Mucor saturninus]